MTLNEKIKKIAEYYGLESQLTKLAEECAEYAAARLKYQGFFDKFMYEREGRQSSLTAMDAAEKEYEKELSDVFLVVLQIEYLMETQPELREEILQNMEFKADRQLKRIEQDKKERLEEQKND